LIEPSIFDKQLWQENIPSSINNLNSDKPIENKNETDPRSLLGKSVFLFFYNLILIYYYFNLRILKIDHENQSIQEQDRILFLQSLFFSSLNISINKEHCFFK